MIYFELAFVLLMSIYYICVLYQKGFLLPIALIGAAATALWVIRKSWLKPLAKLNESIQKRLKPYFKWFEKVKEQFQILTEQAGSLLKIFRDNKRLWARALGIPLLLLCALHRLPHDYYLLIKFVICAMSLHCAYDCKTHQKFGWSWLMGAIALLFNPFVPIHLSSVTWKAIDWISALILSILLTDQIRESSSRLQKEAGKKPNSKQPTDKPTEPMEGKAEIRKDTVAELEKLIKSIDVFVQTK